MSKIKLICVVGATASGKTALGVELAKALDGEIISADSMQVYKGMPIATAVATKKEQQGIPHYLTEILDLDESFSVADFISMAKPIIEDIVSRGKTPIVVGGTGLFIDSLVKGISFSEIGVDTELRNRLMQQSGDSLYEELCRVDPQSASEIHKNNTKRVIRALELYYGGVSKTRQNEQSLPSESPYDALYIGINYENRDILYDRINKRVELMLENGLVDEAEKAYSMAGTTAKQAIGHKELKAYLDGVVSLDEAVNKLKAETRHYAKRQLTWFRRNDKIKWLYADKTDTQSLIDDAVQTARNFLL